MRESEVYAATFLLLWAFDSDCKEGVSHDWRGGITDLWSWLSIVMVCLSKFGFKGILKNVDKKSNLWSGEYLRGYVVIIRGFSDF